MINFIKFIWNVWFKLPEKIRFLLVGGFNTVVSYIMFAWFVWLFGESHYQLSLMLAWVLSSVISFSTQKIFVFCTKGQWLKEYLKCCMSWMIAYLINAGMLELAIKVLLWNVYIGQGVAILITTVVTYILFKKFAFRRN